jgi:hypothetical protein
MELARNGYTKFIQHIAFTETIADHEGDSHPPENNMHRPHKAWQNRGVIIRNEGGVITRNGVPLPAFNDQEFDRRTDVCPPGYCHDLIPQDVENHVQALLAVIAPAVTMQPPLRVIRTFSRDE